MAQAAKKVEIYSTPTCLYCNAAKDFFNTHGVQYAEYNVATDLAKRQEMVDRSGQLGVPVIVVGDEVIVGFDEARLSKLVGV